MRGIGRDVGGTGEDVRGGMKTSECIKGNGGWGIGRERGRWGRELLLLMEEKRRGGSETRVWGRVTTMERNIESVTEKTRGWRCGDELEYIDVRPDCTDIDSSTQTIQLLRQIDLAHHPSGT